MKKKLIILSVFVLSPFIAFADFCTSNAGQTTIQGAICTIGNILNAVIPVLVVIAIIYFIWGVIRYVISTEEESKAKGRTMIIYGIIGIAVIVGLWGLVNMLLGTFGLQNGPTAVPLPTVQLQ